MKPWTVKYTTNIPRIGIVINLERYPQIDVLIGRRVYGLRWGVR